MISDLCYCIYRLHFIEKEPVVDKDGFRYLRLNLTLWVLYPQEDRVILKERAELVEQQIRLFTGE